ncbi:uncharacterized protein LOC116195754 [Punica granatum]|uniref:Uncharacterized protein LOC116195754 n=2 Tax=Punica granatum TaxID=22663 RepID=A0A6P8CD80_PUNGR|nr:uncharacterized protein LOC116195754 [Punica granatum]XP_031380953.1 uncharacterized protein LOC116195754 [Punica granatum]OWM81734.1 hypothetical protein CDL15_Pgr007772 [Punica granatum]PKI34509.1 hypothetical protein CRG98_045046 [Punica granatum]
MVAMVRSATPRERLARPLSSAKVASDIPSKLDHLRQVKDDLLQDDPVLLAEFLPQLLDLLSDRFSPVRKFIIKVAGEIGMKQPEFLPEIVPALISVLKDESPPVVRQAIASGIDLFRCTFEKIALQGLYSSELDDSLESSWAWMLNFKEKIYSIAFQPGSDGVKLMALKFVEAIVLLYTPDPSGTSEPPSHQRLGGDLAAFNISWLRGGHPLLSVGSLSQEASHSLGKMLDQLRFPKVKSLSSLTIIVLINSVSAVAKKRPAFYGRILPVLLGLDSISHVVNGVHIYGARHALKNAFLSCLESKHPGAAPWRDRLNSALREIEDGGLTKQSLDQDYKINGSAEGKDSSLMTTDEKSAVKAIDSVSAHGVKGRKRLEVEDRCDQASDDNTPGKRARPSPSISEESSNELKRKSSVFQEEHSSSQPSPSRLEGDSGPVQQLVAMFGALVAQGEKAAGSLEILISSISADLLAEVVMANMRRLPSERPTSDEEETSKDIFSLSSAFPQIASLLGAQQTVPNDYVELPKEDDDVVAVDEMQMVDTENIHGAESSAWPAALPSSSDVSTGIGKDIVTTSADKHRELEDIESEIPGLAASTHTDGQSESAAASSLASTDAEANSQEQETSLIAKSPVEMLPSLSNDRSEELSPKPITMDGNMSVSSPIKSAGLSYHVVLPKLSAPVVELPDDQKDHLQKLAFARIIEAYKDVEVAGGSEVRSSLLSYIGVEFPSELEPWKRLHQHIVSDYVNLEGHELTLRLLYRLFGESEVEKDFFSSTTAASAYEMLLLNVAEALRDSFPASDKSLSRLLSEVPYLPESILKLLEQLCSPDHAGKPEESQSGDRVTQGLSAVWSLILLRPPMCDACLKIALQSTIHPLEEVRMKAIRLVANKLYPLSSISQQIEDFAKDTLLSVTSSVASDKVENERSHAESLKDSVIERGPEEHLIGDSSAKDVSSDTHQSSNIESLSNAVSEAHRCMSLYFALCTKKHALFRHIFMLYESASKSAKEAIQRHIPILVRTMGASCELLEIISDASGGSLNLLMQVLHTLTDGTVPSPGLIRTIRKLYDSKIMDVEILMPILPFLHKDEVLVMFPRLVNLAPDKFQAALMRILTGSSSHGDPPVSPAEILIAIHGIDPDRDGIPLKKVTDACNACFEQRQIFTQQVLAKVLNQLVEQIPLPLLFMRTVLQSIGAFPGLVGFIMDILSRLVSKQIWKYPKLWVGFLKCAQLTKPQSFAVLLQLPPAQLENALNRIPVLKDPLATHASQPNVRSSLPRSVLAVLGIVTDSQTSGQAQSSPAQSNPPRSSPAQSSPAKASQTQTSQTQTVDSGTSDKETASEKESSVAS